MCEQCNNEVAEATESKSWLVADNLFINTKGLSMTYSDVIHAEGDIFVTVAPVDEPRAWLTDSLRSVKALLLSKEEQEHFDLHMLRAIHYGYLHAAELNLMWWHGVYSVMIVGEHDFDEWKGTLYSAFESVYKPESSGFRFGLNTSVEAAVAAAEDIFAVKVHPEAIAMLNKIIALIEQGVDVARGDLHDQRFERMLCTLMQLHSYYVNRGAIWVGVGFKGGNPMAVLAKSVFKDGQLQGWILQEQRFGKFIQSVVGPKADARKEIDDLKVLNKAPVVHLCYTEQEWHNAYQAGPGSCMTGFEFDCSPVRVYATGAHGLPDNNLRLCINYRGELFGNGFQVLNRAIVNIKTKQYVRAYGNNADAVMRSLGYEEDKNATNDCILRKLPHPGFDGAYLMPYLDGYYDEVDDLGDHWVIVSNGEHSATNADGYLSIDRCRCCMCEGSFDCDDVQETVDGDVVCEFCAEERYCTPHDRFALYHQSKCTWSEHMQEWVHDLDLVNCDVVGYVHDSFTLLETVQGYIVIEDYVEDRADGYYLTEEACDLLGVEYIPEASDKQEEAA